MLTRSRTTAIVCVLLGLAIVTVPDTVAQEANRPNIPPQVVSPEISPERTITFRILAPKAEIVRLNRGDIPGTGPGPELKKGDEGVWEVTVGPLDPGAYRYSFNVDGVTVVDPRNPSISESNNSVSSIVYLSGSESSDTADVPHGAVAAVTYHSKSLGKVRRLHVYTPPGYGLGGEKYPVFYLLHGSGDSDESWTSIGRAGFILDNLIAAGKARPMLVVMPAGHTRAITAGRRGVGDGPPERPPVDEFVQDFVNDIMPFVEKTYRVSTERKDRAIAGLSMGGSQTLNIAIPNLDKFAYFGVYSSGVFRNRGRGGRGGADTGPTWEERNQEFLDRDDWKPGLRLAWFATGKDDFLVESSRSTVAMLKKHKFDVVYKETSGGHTWINWRIYLAEFAPLLFQN
jgi:enterochelin esterase family protein